MIGSKKTNINDIRVKYWFNREKEARLTFKYGNNEITFLNEASVVLLINWLEKRRFHHSP
jgi:hypothetical protein